MSPLTGSKILLSGSMALDSAEYSKAGMFVLTIILGLIYGFLVELVASVLFNARLVRTTPVSAARV